MEKTKNIAPHVMACKRCEGKGRIFYLDQGGAPLSAKCPVCNGSGRVKVQSKVITRIEPFVPGEDDTELMTMCFCSHSKQKNAAFIHDAAFFLLTSPVKCLILQHIPELMAKGRDKNLIELRDEALCRRYYYWTEVQRLRFDDALKVLSRQEFFISEERIMSIIRRKCRELKDLEVKPVSKVKKPRLTAVQLSLFTGE